MDTQTSISHNVSITLWRELSGYSQEKLAKYSGLCVERICWIEQGKSAARPEDAERIAKVFGIGPNRLLNDPPPIKFIVQTNLERIASGKQKRLPNKFSKTFKEAKAKAMLEYIIDKEDLGPDGYAGITASHLQKYHLMSWLWDQYEGSVLRMVSSALPEKKSQVETAHRTNEGMAREKKRRIIALREHLATLTSDGLRGKIDPEYVTSWIGQSILTREYHGSVTEAIKRLAPHLDASVMKATERRGSKIKEHSNTIERFKKDLAGVDPSSGFLLTAKYCREELGLYLFRSKFGMNPENVARELAPQLISSISYSPKRRRIGLPASSKTPTSQAAPEPPIQSTSVIHYENITAQYCKGKRYMVRLGVTKAMDAMRWLDEYPHQNINADDICRFEGLYSNFMVAAMATKLAESGRKSIAHSKNHLMYELARYIDGKVMEADKPKEESAGRGKSKWVFAKRPSREPNPNYR